MSVDCNTSWADILQNPEYKIILKNNDNKSSAFLWCNENIKNFERGLWSYSVSVENNKVILNIHSNSKEFLLAFKLLGF